MIFKKNLINQIFGLNILKIFKILNGFIIIYNNKMKSMNQSYSRVSNEEPLGIRIFKIVISASIVSDCRNQNEKYFNKKNGSVKAP